MAGRRGLGIWLLVVVSNCPYLGDMEDGLTDENSFVWLLRDRCNKKYVGGLNWTR